uniref:Uncharacterized protein n=1 Tax=Eutreptiella gymnastica TaxID=73025 RepID=A0A7S4LIF5_9EUGL
MVHRQGSGRHGAVMPQSQSTKPSRYPTRMGPEAADAGYFSSDKFFFLFFFFNRRPSTVVIYPPTAVGYPPTADVWAQGMSSSPRTAKDVGRCDCALSTVVALNPLNQQGSGGQSRDCPQRSDAKNPFL